MEGKLKINREIFSKNLILTQKYCEKQFNNNLDKNLASILRSYNPSYEGKKFFEFKFTNINGQKEETELYSFFTNWSLEPYEKDTYHLIPELFEKQMQHKVSLLFSENEPLNMKGEIFAFDVYGTLIDGAAEVSSHGLLDTYNCPPIDTWFYYQKEANLLLAWIPEPFISYANEGIEVNPEECINWFKNWCPKEYDSILDKNQKQYICEVKKLHSWFQR